MESKNVAVGQTYQNPRWKGARKVASIIPKMMGKPALVHYVDLRTSYTGHSELEKFCKGSVLVQE